MLRCSQWLCPLLAFLPFLTVSIAQLPSSNGSRKNRGNRSGNSLHQLPGLSFPGSIYLLSPAFPCRSLALLPSHLSRSQNNKRLICLPPFDEFLMLQTCVRTSGSLLGLIWVRLSTRFHWPRMATNLSVTPAVTQSQQPLVGLRQGLISSEYNGIRHL